MSSRRVPVLAALLGLSLVASWFGSPVAGAADPIGDLRVEIHEPRQGELFTSLTPEVTVRGGASIFGGVKQLDLFLVIDSSKSLERTDPKDQRVAGAVALVRSLPVKSDIQVGVVDFDRNSKTLAPLSADREAAVAALQGLDRHGATDLAEGIETALAGFDARARPESSRVMLLFTDGRSDEDEAMAATAKARARGVAIHTLLLGSDGAGTELLSAIAAGTGGSFVRVTDPARLAEAFLNLRTTGVERVTLAANGGPPVAAKLSGGEFSAPLPLRPGENRLVAVATSLAGETREAEVRVFVSDELSVAIDAPLEGTLYTERLRETVVTGSASLFTDAAPELLAAHPDRGVESVVLHVGESPPFATALAGGRFEGRVLLEEGENQIVATATSVDGRMAEARVLVTVRPPGCGELSVQALRDGEPALSVSERSVEVVVDASGSMWGQIEGRSKMEIAKEILGDALGWLPEDLSLALRVYGHQHAREKRDCTDTELLVPFGPGAREQVAGAIPSFKPRGQTPLAHSLEKLAADFAGTRGERAVVLVTDGIESCGGDPVAAARALQAEGPLPVHVIGFGLGGAEADAASLRAIAHASGGRYIAAESAEGLRQALSVTVGTAFRVRRGGQVVAEGALGRSDALRLPEGEYRLELDSAPPLALPLTVASEQALTLVLERRGEELEHRDQRRPIAYRACEEPAWAEASEPGDPPAALP